jgi:hypothetical protein
MKGEWSGGKGDRRRKLANDQKYRAGWERIFGNKDKSKPQHK